jgi:hypothetical protein
MIVVPFGLPRHTMERIQNVQAEGGDDRAEDVAHALEVAVHQDWCDSDVKIVFHIADAPAHGMAFHSAGVSDRFPRGDPDGFDPRDFVEKMSFLDIHYTFVKIHPSTDTMLEVFHNCYSHGGTFNVIDLRTQDQRLDMFDQSDVLSAELTRSITASITHYYTASQAP